MRSSFSFGNQSPMSPDPWPHSGDGGGSFEAPTWVRPGAKADIDFAHDPPRAWTATAGETDDLSTILGDSALMGVTYDPDGLQPGVGFTGLAALIGPMVTAFAFGFTLRIEQQDYATIEFTEPTYGTDIQFVCGSNPANSVGLVDNGTESSGVSLKSRDELGAGIPTTPGAHTVALTIKSNEMYGGIDGEAFWGYDDDGETTVTDPSTPNDPTDIIIGFAHGVQRMTVYPAKSEADTLAQSVAA